MGAATAVIPGMGLAEIADGVHVTAEQHDLGVATVDKTAVSLSERLEPYAGRLPCDPTAAARIVERYAAGGSVGDAAASAGVPPVTAAKTLHLLGESVSPLSPTGRAVVTDWIAGKLSRTEAMRLTRASPAEFALAAFIETHEPLAGARDAVEGAIDAGALTQSLQDSLREATAEPEALR